MTALKPWYPILFVLCLARSTRGKLSEPSANTMETSRSLQEFDDDVVDDIDVIFEGDNKLEKCRGDVS